MCGCAANSDLELCEMAAELWGRAGLGRIRHVGGGRFRLFCEWYGLPAPVVWLWPIARWFIAANINATGDPLEVGDLPRRIDFNTGCGCVKVLKDAWAWASGGK